ncbi:MAG: hypothetical protein LUQ24_06165 [Methanobacterium sp.]|jgi:hypothetical protein|nr:hypothetical protein [Methanobacterium sp.]
MIENKIKTLRKAAKVSTMQDADKIWCVIAGSEEMINNVSYEAILNKERVSILCREHVSSRESFITQKFDFLMLYGDENKIRDLSLISKEQGGAYLKIAPYYTKNEPNLFLLVGMDNHIKKFMGDGEKRRLDYKFLLEDKTTGFIETDVSLTNKMPSILRKTIDPLFKVADVALSTVLISTHKDNIPGIKELSRRNKLFFIEFDKFLKED